MPSIDRGPAGHVALHVLHVGGRLDRDAAGVERDRLADEAEHEVRLRRPAARSAARSGAAGCALPCATPANAPIPSARISSGPSASALRCSSAAAISCARSASRSGVSSFAGAFARSRARFAASATLHGALGRSQRALVGADEHEPLEGPRPVVVRLPAARVVAAEHEAVDRRAGLLGRGKVEAVVDDPGDRAADLRGGAGDSGGGRPDRVRVESRARAETGRDHAAGVEVEDRRLPARTSRRSPPRRRAPSRPSRRSSSRQTAGGRGGVGSASGTATTSASTDSASSGAQLDPHGRAMLSEQVSSVRCRKTFTRS